MIKVGIIGFGGISKSHKQAYDFLAENGFPIKLVALCDIDKEQFTKASKINLGVTEIGNLEGINLYTDMDEMINKQELDMVDICLPSYLHAQTAIKMLKAGKHVLSEKPMALCEQDCDEMIKAQAESGKKLMIGLCLRFDPLYTTLKEFIDTEKFGKVKTAYFMRLSAMPTGWQRWYYDVNKSGGCIFDMHIHDIDMIAYLFGTPDWVSALATHENCKYTNVDSRFGYKDKTVVAIGEWGHASSFGFAMSYRICFERATVIMEGGKITVYPEEGEKYEHPISRGKRMANEIEYFANLILNNAENTVNPLTSSKLNIMIAKKLCESADNDALKISL